MISGRAWWIGDEGDEADDGRDDSDQNQECPCGPQRPRIPDRADPRRHLIGADPPTTR